ERLILAGQYDDYIHSWARAAKAFQKPLFLRFAHEANGNWYPWGQSSEDYKKMWIHVHDIFAQEGADNVLWVWSPNNTDPNGELGDVLQYYPGNNYVDWLGFSAFNWGNSSEKSRWLTFKQISYPIYAQLSLLNKPIM